MPDMTLEQAQERIVELTDELQNLMQERDTLSQDNESLTEECENLRTLNQKYFNRIMQQDTDNNTNKDEEVDEIPSCVDFAKSINII